jgi:hypothetical protein
MPGNDKGPVIRSPANHGAQTATAPFLNKARTRHTDHDNRYRWLRNSLDD